jgi:hypothetical protein
MTKTCMFVMISLFGMLLLTACISTSESVLPTPAPSATPLPTVEKTLPTPVSPGQTVIYGNFQVEMLQAEITSSYVTEYGSTRQPPAGINFLWIHIGLKNTSVGEQVLPTPDHFSVLDGAIEFKPTYGRRQEHADYMVLPAGLVQGQAVDAWLRFDIPADLELKKLAFAFLPESTQVSVGFSSSASPSYDHPIFLWTCAP